MIRVYTIFSLVLMAFLPASISANEPPPILPKMPVKEITVFKDGHALMLHEGRMATDANGHVVLDQLPTPVIGTFWPYAADARVKLTSVTAGRKRLAAERTALTLREIVQANIGTEAIVTENNGVPYPATIVGFLTRDPDDMEAMEVPSPPVSPPHATDLLLLKTAEATRVVQFGRIQDVRFPGKYQTKLTSNELRNVLTMKFDWGGAPSAKEVQVGMAYLQKGIRWIPNYRVEIDGNGKAAVKLQATLLNEMTDLDDVTVNLVIGVPTFAFKDTIDPIALGRTLAGLSQYFEQGSATAHGLSNAMMTQMARSGEHRRPGPEPVAQPADLGPDVAAGKDEDLFVYTLKNITLKKGQRLVVPVAQFNVEYKDIYVMDLPFVPPPEIRQPRDSAQQTELAKLFHAPKVMHKIRLNNTSNQPLSTAPALIVHNNRVLAQGMMTYTSPGAQTDLPITTAVDIQVKKVDKETKRIPNAANWNGHQYRRVELAGAIHFVNRRKTPVELEIVRHVLGNIDGADQDGKAEMVNVFEDDGYGVGYQYPNWWRYYSWNDWWYHFNGVGRITWQAKLEPGASVDLGYNWHYYVP